MAEFKVFLASLDECFRPVGPMEQLLVQKIAISIWRQRRAIRAEVGEIRKSQDSLSYNLMIEHFKEVTELIEHLLIGEFREKLKETSLGLHHLISVLEDIQSEVK